jgi:beta-phosphoglucomutase-like phosphatase (HAD superfamily)
MLQIMELENFIAGTFDALIFDCDNTLAHTAPLHFECLREVLLSHGHELNEAWYRERVGLSGGDLMRDIAQRDGRAPPWKAVAAELPARYIQLVSQVEEIAHITALVRFYAGRMPMAVASGSTGALVHATLRAIGLQDCFEVVTSLDDVNIGKPSPAIFLEAARRLKVAPERCLVFEDSAEGFEAARRARMHVLDVASMREPEVFRRHE